MIEITTVFKKYEKYLCNLEINGNKTKKGKLHSKVLLVRMYEEQIKVFEAYIQAGIKSRSELFRLLIDSHKLIRILLKYSQENFKLQDQTQWKNEDFNFFYDYLDKFNEFENLLKRK